MSIVKNILHYDSGAIRSDDGDKLKLTDLYEELKGHNDLKDLLSDVEHDKNKFVNMCTRSKKSLCNSKEVISMLGRVENLLSINTSIYGDEDNWKKGISIIRSINSVFRHLVLYLLADTKEDHLAAIIFNVLAIDATECKIRTGELEITYDGRCDGKHLEAYYGFNNVK